MMLLEAVHQVSELPRPFFSLDLAEVLRRRQQTTQSVKDNQLFVTSNARLIEP